MQPPAELKTLDLAGQFRLKAESLLEGLSHPAARWAPLFDERRYLFSNPEVVEAVHQGLVASGFAHWLKCGWAEERAGGPPEPVPDRRLAVRELERRPLGFNIYGNFSTPSGVGGVARGISLAVEHLGIPVNRIDVPPGLDATSLESPKPYRVNLFFPPLNGFERFLRLAGTSMFEGAYNIGFWFWELPAPHPYWCRFFRYFDEIWAGSNFCRDAFQCLTNLPVVRIPPLVDGLALQATHSRAHFNFPEDVFVFTYVFDIGSYVARKNPLCLIKAFRSEFGDSPRVALFLKVWNSKSDLEALHALEAAIEGAPNIRIYDGVFTDSEMASLHRHADCLVSPHRSEGFGLNIAESMYFGNPVIATGYSANLDFMNNGNGYLIDCKLAPLAETEGPYWKGGVWAEPSEEHLRKLMRRVVDEPAERARKGEAARQTIHNGHSLSAVATAIGERLDEIGLRSPDLSGLELHRHPERAWMFRASMNADAFRQVLEVEPRFGISVTMAVSGRVEEPTLRRSIASVRAQWYPLWDLSIVEDGSATPEVRYLLESLRGRDERIKVLFDCPDAKSKAVEISMYEYLIALEPGGVLAPSALLDCVRKPSGLLSKREFYS
jgi:glycosyltransferase involved in cell wall biosynthesis